MAHSQSGSLPIAPGMPAWFELGASKVEEASDFYGRVIGWQMLDAQMPGRPYFLAKAVSDSLVAGVLSTSDSSVVPVPGWTVYFATADCDASAARVERGGGVVLSPPAEVPGTGTYAVCADPQGAVFGLLQPPVVDAEIEFPPFHTAPGHSVWHELMTSDSSAACDFYADLLGWTKGDAMDMGPMGIYQNMNSGDRPVGAIMGPGLHPGPVWLTYFGTTSAKASAQRIKDAGGEVRHGPAEIPGGAHIVVATDPQGAWFAVVGPEGA